MVYFLYPSMFVNTRLKGSMLHKSGNALETNVTLVKLYKLSVVCLGMFGLPKDEWTFRKKMALE